MQGAIAPLIASGLVAVLVKGTLVAPPLAKKRLGWAFILLRTSLGGSCELFGCFGTLGNCFQPFGEIVTKQFASNWMFAITQNPEVVI